MNYQAYIFGSYGVAVACFVFILFQIVRDHKKIKSLNNASNKKGD